MKQPDQIGEFFANIGLAASGISTVAAAAWLASRLGLANDIGYLLVFAAALGAVLALIKFLTATSHPAGYWIFNGIVILGYVAITLGLLYFPVTERSFPLS